MIEYLCFVYYKYKWARNAVGFGSQPLELPPASSSCELTCSLPLAQQRWALVSANLCTLLRTSTRSCSIQKNQSMAQGFSWTQPASQGGDTHPRRSWPVRTSMASIEKRTPRKANMCQRCKSCGSGSFRCGPGSLQAVGSSPPNQHSHCVQAAVRRQYAARWDLRACGMGPKWNCAAQGSLAAGYLGPGFGANARLPGSIEAGFARRRGKGAP